MQRIHTIDYLRGLMALSVMIYHYLSWSTGIPQSDALIGRLGVYAVSTFYIISGVSLYLVYSETKWSMKEVGSFVVKRYFRIAPVFWLATLLMIILYIMKNHSFSPDWSRYASNLSLTFGFYAPRDYIPGGGWSIGNEMVFYAFFPLLIMATARPRVFMSAIAFVFFVYCYFAFFVLTPSSSLAAQWGPYINPLNQAFLFALGVAIGWFRDLSRTPSQAAVWVVLVVSVALLTFYPASGNQINIVTGINRLLFTLFCGGLCFAAVHWQGQINHHLSSVLKFFGDISYALYLLHIVLATYVLQIVLPALGVFSTHQKASILFLNVLPVAILLSYLCYRYIEKPAIRLGKKITAPRKVQGAVGEHA